MVESIEGGCVRQRKKKKRIQGWRKGIYEEEEGK